jgi:hypothetical protein
MRAKSLARSAIYREYSDVLYRALFDMDGAALRITFGLPPAAPSCRLQDTIRQKLGNNAFLAAHFTEEIALTRMRKLNLQTEADIKADLRKVAAQQRRKYRQFSAEDGVDFLTGKPLNKETATNGRN